MSSLVTNWETIGIYSNIYTVTNKYTTQHILYIDGYNYIKFLIKVNRLLFISVN